MLPLKICANVECCHDFVASWMLARLRCKWSVVMASWEKWMLAQLRYEWSVDVAPMQIKCWGSFMKKRVLVRLQYKDKCWHGFMVKTLDVAMLQRLLRWLHWKDKCWCSLIAKKSMLHNKNKQQQRACQKKISWHVHLKYHTTHSRLFVQFNEYLEWLYIGILRS